MAEAPPPELRARMDRVVLRVHSDAKAAASSQDDVLLGAGAGARYAAGNVAVTAGKTGLYIIAGGCHPAWGLLWFATCPAGAAAGAAVGVGSALVGGVAGAAYGATQARPKEQFDAAQATLDRVLAGLRPAEALRDQLSRTVNERKIAEVVDAAAWDAAADRLDDPAAPITIAIDVHQLSITRSGRLTPQLELSLAASVRMLDAPEAGLRYSRGWLFSSSLGGFYALTDQGGDGLRRALDDALRAVASAIVEDLFLSTEAVPVRHVASADGELVTTFAHSSESTREWFVEHKRKAACGDVEAQRRLAAAYAGIEPLLYGAAARSAAFEGYVWWRRAAAETPAAGDFARLVQEFRARLSADEMRVAERRSAKPASADCGAATPSSERPAAMPQR